jgi:hypothetical protein
MGSILEAFGGQNLEILGSWGLRGGFWEPCWNPWPARGAQVAKKARKGSPLGAHFGGHFEHFFGFWWFFLQSDFESIFGWLLSWILEGFMVIFWVIFCVFFGHFRDAAAEVENVVWIQYLLQIKHMGICQHRRKTS